MTQTQFNTLFNAGDAGAAWAAVENHITQQRSALLVEKDAVITAAAKLNNDLQKKVADIRVAVLNPDIQTEPTILTIIADETEKAIAAAVVERDEAQRKLNNLLLAVPESEGEGENKN